MAKQTFTTGQVLTAAQMTSLQQTAMGGGSATAKTASYTLVAADAGTTVIMNSASATTITVNTSLFSAGDTIFIQNIGAGVSTITAGTATVNTASSLALAQYESGNLYFTAAGASIFSKADGAAAGGGGMTLLSTTSLSGATTTVTISDATYINLFVVAYRVSNDTNNGDFRFKLNSDATMTQADLYRFSSTTGTGGVGGGFLNLTNGNGILRTNNDNYFAINIYNYASAAQYKAFDFRGIFSSTQSGNPVTVEFGAGGYPTNTAITSLIFENSNGNLNGGTVLVYGVK